MSALTVRRSSLYGWLAVAFLLLNGSNLGAYSSRFGPYFLLAMLLILASLYALRMRELVLQLRSGDVVLGAVIFGLLFVAALVSRNGQALELSKPMLGDLIVFMLAAWLARNLIHSRWFDFAVLVAILFVSALNGFEFVFSPNLLSTAPGRAAGFFGNPNNSGTALAGLTALWLARTRGALRRTDLTIFAVAFMGIAVTFSRGAMLVLLLSAGTVVLFRARSANASTRTLASAGAALALLSVLVVGGLRGSELSQDAALRLESVLQSDFRDESSSSRLSSAEYYIFLFVQNPILGAGPFSSLSAPGGAGPHNSFIAAAADFGALGLSAFLLILYRGLARARRLGWSEPTAQRLLGLVIWLGVASLFSHNVFYDPFGAMMVGFLLGGASTVIRRSVPSHGNRVVR